MSALSKGAAVAASFAVVAWIAFDAALGEPQANVIEASAAVPAPTPAPPVAASESETEPDPSAAMRRIQTFTAAVTAHHGALGGWEREQLRSVFDLDAELQAARDALEQNPGCVRASYVYQANLERKAEQLRSIYIRGN